MFENVERKANETGYIKHPYSFGTLAPDVGESNIDADENRLKKKYMGINEEDPEKASAGAGLMAQAGFSNQRTVARGTEAPAELGDA